MIKVAVFDVDDTLYETKNMRFTTSAVQAISALQAQNILVIIATGRPPISANAVLDAGIYPDYMVCANGHLVLDRQGKIILSETLSTDAADKMYAFCAQENIGLLFKYPDHSYVYVKDSVFEPLYRKAGPNTHHFIFNVTDEHYRRQPNGATIADYPEKTARFNELFKDSCFAVHCDKGIADVMKKGVSKDTGISFVLAREQISPKDIIAFGDSDNDIEMLKYAGNSVAMGNASERLKQCADYITDPIEQDGIYHALIHYNLLPDKT